MSAHLTDGDANSRRAEAAHISARMLSPWTEAEISRFIARAGLFQRRGMHADDAEHLADRLALRDQERDDRRCCVECAHLQQTRTCFRRLPTSLEQLIRCSGFEWQKP